MRAPAAISTFAKRFTSLKRSTFRRARAAYLAVQFVP